MAGPSRYRSSFMMLSRVFSQSAVESAIGCGGHRGGERVSTNLISILHSNLYYVCLRISGLDECSKGRKNRHKQATIRMCVRYTGGDHMSLKLPCTYIFPSPSSSTFPTSIHQYRSAVENGVEVRRPALGSVWFVRQVVSGASTHVAPKVSHTLANHQDEQQQPHFFSGLFN